MWLWCRPKVLSAKELERAKSNVKVYDAVLAPSTVVLPTPVDPDFEVFNDLLQDYLQRTPHLLYHFSIIQCNLL